LTIHKTGRSLTLAVLTRSPLTTDYSPLNVEPLLTCGLLTHTHYLPFTIHHYRLLPCIREARCFINVSVSNLRLKGFFLSRYEKPIKIFAYLFGICKACKCFEADRSKFLRHIQIY